MKSSVQALGDHSRDQAVLSRIGSLDGFIDSLKLKNVHNRAEDLLLRDLHIVCDVREDSRLHEEAGPVNPLASAHELGALFFTALNQRENLIDLDFGYLRSALDSFLEGISDFSVLGGLNSFLHEGVIDIFMDEGSRTSHTNLPTVKESSKV